MSESTEYQAVENGQWWSRPWFVACATMIAMGVVLAVVLLLWPGDDDTQAAGAEQSATETSAAQAPTDATADAQSASICGLDSSDNTSLTKAPRAEWGQAVGGISVPVSEDHGPGQSDESTEVRSCFAQSPEGAVLAAASLITASGDTEVLAETIEQRSVDSAGKDVALSQITQGDTGGAPPIQIAGFRLLNYSPEQATVEIVAEVQGADDTTLITTGADLVWTNGDWYATYAADGSGGPVAGQVSSLNGYTPWGPTDG